MSEKITWAEAFENSLESWRDSLFSDITYDRNKHVFSVSSSPRTYREIIESAEMDEFEEYGDTLPEWDDEAERLFKADYLPKIKKMIKKWESHIMKCAEKFDKHYQFDENETATEYFTEYFKVFWA